MCSRRLWSRFPWAACRNFPAVSVSQWISLSLLLFWLNLSYLYFSWWQIMHCTGSRCGNRLDVWNLAVSLGLKSLLEFPHHPLSLFLSLALETRRGQTYLGQSVVHLKCLPYKVIIAPIKCGRLFIASVLWNVCFSSLHLQVSTDTMLSYLVQEQ